MFGFSRAPLAALSCLVILVSGLAGCARQTISAPPAAGQAPPSLAPGEAASPSQAAPPPPPGSPAAALVGRTDLALLVPLSGPNAALGQDMLDAAALALFETGSDDLALTPKDTAASPTGAADAARAALADGARLVIGPLTANDVMAVRPVTEPSGVSVVAFSNQVQVAGGNVFLLGFLPQLEAQRVAAYARSTGLQRFAVLAPSNAYGRLAAQSFEDATNQDGGQIDQAQFYDPGDADPSPAIRALLPRQPPDPTQVAEPQTATPVTPPLIPPTFAALMLPEPNAQRLRNLGSMLAAADLDPRQIRLLGVDSWDVANLGNEAGLVGGWYAAPPPAARAGFEQRFRAAYGHAPQRLATLAYDAVAMAAVLARSPGASFSAAALETPSGFAGVDGIFRFRPDGTAERGLAVLQVERRGTSVISPAPDSFSTVAQ